MEKLRAGWQSFEKGFHAEWRPAILAAIIILCSATLPRFFGRIHNAHDFDIFRYLVMASMFILVFPVINALGDGVFGRLIPTWIVRKIFKKEHVVIGIMIAITILWNVQHHSWIRSIGSIATNLIFLSVFFKKGFWQSVATSIAASMIVGVTYSILVLFR